MTDTASKSTYNTPPYWPWKSQDSFEGIVHRIDKQTSGIVVVAKHSTAATALHESFKMRKVHKEYLAIAVGLPSTPTLATSMQPATENLPLQNHLSLPPTPLSKEIKQCGRNVSCNSLMVVLGWVAAAEEEEGVGFIFIIGCGTTVVMCVMTIDIDG